MDTYSVIVLCHCQMKDGLVLSHVHRMKMAATVPSDAERMARLSLMAEEADYGRPYVPFCQTPLEIELTWPEDIIGAEKKNAWRLAREEGYPFNGTAEMALGGSGIGYFHRKTVKDVSDLFQLIVSMGLAGLDVPSLARVVVANDEIRNHPGLGILRGAIVEVERLGKYEAVKP